MRNASTSASGTFAIRDTCDLQIPSIPSACSARRLRSSCHSGTYEPLRSLGIASSIVPARVSRSRDSTGDGGWVQHKNWIQHRSAGVKVTAAGTFWRVRDLDWRQNGRPVRVPMSINPLSVGGKPEANPVSASDAGVTWWGNVVMIGLAM